jgi:hypothetical protein
MRLLFLGYEVSEIEGNRLEGASIAGDRMQLGIINALTDQPNGVILDAVTVRPLAPFHQSAPLAELARRADWTEPKISYHGRVSSDAIPGITQEALLLINNRRVDDPMSEFTFPSKILEYMLSGTLLLSKRLNRFTEEYEGKMFFMGHGTVEEIAHAIDDLVRRAPDELRDTAERAREFVVEERSLAAQGSLMRRFLSRGMS